MTSGSQQLVDDYEQLKSSLELYPKIVILKTEGQPPDNYEIGYSLKGVVKEADGSIAINDSHRIHISLPFGYPHFPPTVKPLSNIFHPDVDPAAIRIAEQWQNNPSLADLVLHIGEMISGNIYNVDDLDGGSARVTFREGGLLAARFEEFDNQEAVYAILSQKHGTFRFIPGLPDSLMKAREIGDFMMILMEGLKRLDEEE